jgi:flagellar biosynthesis/type III secretory pathway protein FliH
MMTTIEWKSDFIEGFHQQGREEGRQEGRQEGLQEGLQEGREQGLQESKTEYLLKIIDARRIALTEQERQQVSSCTDLAQLDQWFGRALNATTAADIFKD